jgi:hypothetical protein
VHPESCIVSSFINFSFDPFAFKWLRPLEFLKSFDGKVDSDFGEFCLYCFCTNSDVKLDRIVEQNAKT